VSRGMETQSLFPEFRVKKDVSDWPIIGGAFMIVGSLAAFYLAVSAFLFLSTKGPGGLQFTFSLILGIFLATMVLLGIGSIIGGVAAIRRKPYRLAVVGGVCSVFCSSVIGLIGLILVVKSKNEFVDNKGKNQGSLHPPRKSP